MTIPNARVGPRAIRRAALAALALLAGATLGAAAEPGGVEEPFDMVLGVGGVPIGSATLQGFTLTVTFGGVTCPSPSPTSTTAILDLRGLRRRPSIFGVLGRRVFDARIVEMPDDTPNWIRIEYSDDQRALQDRLAALPREARRPWDDEDYDAHGLRGRIPVARTETTYCDGSMAVRHLGLGDVALGLLPDATPGSFLTRLNERAASECFAE